MYIVNSIGENTPPWQTPSVMENLSERDEFHEMLTFCWEYHANKVLATTGDNFLLSNLSNSKE